MKFRKRRCSAMFCITLCFSTFCLPFSLWSRAFLLLPCLPAPSRFRMLESFTATGELSSKWKSNLGQLSIKQPKSRKHFVPITNPKLSWQGLYVCRWIKIHAVAAISICTYVERFACRPKFVTALIVLCGRIFFNYWLLIIINNNVEKNTVKVQTTASLEYQ